MIDRNKRYKEKIELIEERLDDVGDLVVDFNDKVRRLACYKAFQEIIEAMFDLVSMMIKDKDKGVEDDYTNLEKLKDLNIINENELKILQEGNGLRNRLIHRYNKTDDKIAMESMESLLPRLNKIVEKFKNEINK